MAKVFEKYLETGDNEAKRLMDGLERANGSKPSPAFAVYTMIHWTFSIGGELQGYGFPFDCPLKLMAA